MVQSLRTGRRTTLVEGGWDAWYRPTGHLVYASEGSVFAVPFDARTLALTGSAASVIHGVRRETLTSGMASFAFSDSGSLDYAPGPPLPAKQVLALFDRKGGAQPLDVPPGRYNYPRVSPDGSRVAFETTDGKQNAIAIFDLSGASAPRRLTFGGNNRFPVWSNDSAHVAFQSDRDADAAVFWQPVDGTVAERLTRPARGVSHIPESWDPRERSFFQ